MSKISISAVENVMKELGPQIVEVDWHGNNLVIKKTLSLQEMLSFVDGVVNGCFNQDTFEYMPEAKDFVLMASIVEYYSNVRLPDNIERKYALLHNTDLVSTIVENFDSRQFEEMNRAIASKVKSRVDSNTERLAKMIAEIGDRVLAVVNQFSEAYADVTKDDINNIIHAVSGGKIDEDKIVKLAIAHNDDKQSEKE